MIKAKLISPNVLNADNYGQERKLAIFVHINSYSTHSSLSANRTHKYPVTRQTKIVKQKGTIPYACSEIAIVQDRRPQANSHVCFLPIV